MEDDQKPDPPDHAEPSDRQEGAGDSEQTHSVRDKVLEVDLPDGRTVLLLPTAHVSRQSVEDVRNAVAELDVDAIAVELCPARHRTIVDADSWRQLDIFKVLKEGNAPLLLSSLVMTAFQKRIAKELGVVPGAEMIEGIRQAEERELELLLIDRDIQITLRRTWRRLSWWARLKMLSQLIGGLFIGESVTAEEVERLKDEEQLGDLLEGLAEAFPQVKATLIDERDLYLADRLRESKAQRVLAVLGAGHVPGVQKALREGTEPGDLVSLPPKSIWPKILKWSIPVVIIALLAVGFVRGGVRESAISFGLWFVINGALSALGAAVALGHPLTVLSAFLAAPLTSLNPLIAAGWVAGLVQAWVRRPAVQDLEDLPEAITTVRGFWSNPVSRVLLVVVLANLGSTLGTFIAGSWIAARTL